MLPPRYIPVAPVRPVGPVIPDAPVLPAGPLTPAKGPFMLEDL